MKKEMMYVVVGSVLKVLEWVSILMFFVAIFVAATDPSVSTSDQTCSAAIMAICLMIASLGLNRIAVVYGEKICKLYWQNKKSHK